MRLIGGAVLATAVLALAGCGANAGQATGTADQEARGAPVTSAPQGPVIYDTSEVVRFLHLKHDFYTAPSGQKCEIAVVLTSAADVSMYADAGDTVATNPDGTAGVKIVDPEAKTCRRLITSALATFPPS